MASKKAAAAAEAPEQAPADVYAAHNDATAQEWPKEKQCQCEKCQAFLATK